MQSRLESAIGLPSRSTSASRMLAFLMPADVRRNLIQPPGVITADENFLGAYGCLRGETGRPPKTHRLRPDPASRPQGTFRNAGAGDLVRRRAARNRTARTTIQTRA